MFEELIDPSVSAASTETFVLAERKCNSLDGKVIGLVDVGKNNADNLLAGIEAGLVGRYAIGRIVRERKEFYGTTMPADQAQHLVEQCDVIITAAGDCGSCSAATIADSLMFERMGVPAASVITDAFVVSSDAAAKVQGAHDYRYATIPHPLAGLARETVLAYGERVVPELLAILGVEKWPSTGSGT